MTYNRKLFLVSGIVAGINALVPGIAFFWVGPSTAPGRPAISLMCFTVTFCFGVLRVCLLQRLRKCVPVV